MQTLPALTLEMRKILAVIARDPPFRRRVAFTMRRLTRVAKPPLVKRIPARITQHHPSIRRRVVLPSVSPFPRLRLLRRRHHTVSLSNKNKKEFEIRFDFFPRAIRSINQSSFVPSFHTIHTPSPPSSPPPRVHVHASSSASRSSVNPVRVGVYGPVQSVSQRRSQKEKKCVGSFLGRLGNADLTGRFSRKYPRTPLEKKKLLCEI